MFVTTILMVVLLIVALSTATFAWYTANSQVTVSATQINSASSADANIEFVWKSGANYVYNGTSVAFSSGSAIAPMVPTAVPTVDSTSSMSFVGAAVNAAGTTFVGDSEAITPWTQQYTSVAVGSSYELTTEEPANWATHYTNYYTQGGSDPNYTYNRLQVQAPVPAWAANTYYALNASTSDPYGVATGVTVTDLYIANRATSGSTGNLKITATFANGDSNKALLDALRVAVFFGGTYKGTLANSASNVSFATSGSWSADAAVTSSITRDSTYTATAGATGFNIGSINAGAETALVLYAWYDGTLLGNAQAGGNVTFTLTVAKA